MNSSFFRCIQRAVGAVTVLATCASVSLSAHAQTFSNPATITLPDSGSGVGPATPYPSSITVTGVSGNVTDVNVTLNGLRHNFPDDVDVLLVGPGGQKVLLQSDVGGGEDTTSLTVTLDDEATASLPDETQLTSGTFKPTNFISTDPSNPNSGSAADPFPAPAPAGPYGAVLSNFDGTSANGTWNLYVVDDVAQFDTGRYAGGWSLSITAVSDPTGPAALVVTTTADSVAADGVISLREAIRNANGDGVNSAITFSASVFAASRQTITLGGSQLPDIIGNGTLSISAPAVGVQISGNGASRVFSVGANTNVTLTGLTITGGNASGNGGGGINNSGTVLVDACTFSGNSAAEGGAIFSGSTLLTIRNCTLSGNTATTRGGALYNLNGLSVIESSTIAGNTAPAGGGSGVASFGDNATRTEVRNSIISGNTGTDVDLAFGTNNTFQSNGFNLIGDGNATGEFNQSGDVINNSNPGLAALAENGGRTPTRALLSTSPAVNTGDTTLTIDQRGVTRPQGGADDKGAFELQAEAQSLVVTTVADTQNAFDNLTSLREAINFANSNADSSAITFSATVFAAPRKTITVSGVLPVITTNLSVTAPSAGVEVTSSTVPVNFGLFTVQSGTTTLSNLSISASNTGIFVRGGSLNVQGCTFNRNSTGIYIQDGTATVLNCTFIGTGQGNGLFLDRQGDGATVQNCTFTGNEFGIFNSSGITLIVGSCTFTGNNLGIFNSGGNVLVSNSILAGNRNSNSNIFGPYNDSGYNLFDDDGGGLAVDATTQINTNPGFDPAGLKDNGGPTPTIALAAGSAAIDKGDSNLTTDQRGLARPFDDPNIAPAAGGDNSDIGAFEVQQVLNRAPVVTNFSVTATEDVVFTFAENGFDAAFSDPDGNTLQSVRVVTLPGSGTLRLNGVAVTANQVIARGDLDMLTFTPAANFNGSTSFTYNASDGTLFAASNATVTLNVSSVNDAPTISAIADQSTSEDTATGAIAFSVGDVETAPASLTLAATSTNTSLVPVSGIVFGGSGANRTVTVTPAANASGSATITVTVNDGTTGASEPFVLSVTAANDAPTLDAIANLAISEDAGSQTVNLSGISAGGGESQTLSITATSDNIALIPNPSVTYSSPNTTGSLSFTPVANAAGSALITVTVNDGVTSFSRTFTVTVGAVNDLPVASAQNVTVNEDAPVTIALTASDGDGDALTYLIVTPPAHGSLSALSGNQVTYTPAANYNGPDSFSFKANDGTGDSDPALVSITVQGVNDAPVANNDSVSTPALTPVKIAVLSNDSDVDGDTLSIQSVTQPARGGVVINSDGTLTYTGNGTVGEDSFTYTIADGQGGISTATVTVTRTELASTPNAKVTGSGTIAVSGGSASFRLSVQVKNGTPTGSVSFDNSPGGVFVRSISITAIVLDSTGTTARIYGTAKLNGAGSTPFFVEVADVGEPGVGRDTFGIVVGSYSAQGVLSSGNIQVHKVK